MTIRIILAFIIIFINATKVYPAPIKEINPGGLNFGMSVSDIQKMGIVIDYKNELPGRAYIAVTDLPKKLSDFDHARIVIGDKYGLTGVKIYSTYNANDVYGEAVVSRLLVIKKYLEDIYGAGKPDLIEPQGEYSNPEKFAMAIEKNAARMRYLWTVDNIMIELRVGAKNGETNYILEYTDIERANEIGRIISESEVDALQ